MSDLIHQIKSKVSKELYKNAEKILSLKMLLFCREVEEKIFEFSVLTKDKILDVFQIDFKEDILSIINDQDITVNRLAAVIHYYSNKNVLRYKENCTTSKKELKIDKREFNKPVAHLKIEVKGDALHATSTWEFCKISVKIFYKNKSYIGSNNKLRQLRFDETKSNSVKIQDFSFLDRQIIRFLTQYAEPDGTDFSLNADLTAEFLHCFNDEKALFLNSKPIVIHTENVEFIGLYKKKDSKLIAGILVKGKILPMQNANFVAGKCGFWLGYLGEYWWTPIHADLLWIRNFIMSEGMPFDNASKLLNIPFPVIDFSGSNVSFMPCMPIYYINMSEDGQIILSLKFKYLDKELSLSNVRLGSDKKTFWKRDKITEDLAVNEIKTIGFTPEEGHSGHFSISDLEQKGLFLDKVLNVWLKKSKHIFYSPEAAQLAFNIYDLKIQFYNPKQKNGSWTFEYEISNQHDGFINWNKLVRSIKCKRSYIELENKLIARISRKLTEFVEAFQGIIVPVKGRKNLLSISNAALLYLLEVSDDVIENIPKEWLRKRKDISQSNSGVIESGINRFSGELRKYQVTAVNWMYDMIKKGFNSILADEMGLGKTIQTLALINVLREEGKNPHPCMVVCPTSLVENWRSEAETFTPGLKVEVISGNKRAEVLAEINNYDVLITSYALIKRDSDYYKKTTFSLLVLDEAQHIKNPSTINAKVCKSLNTKHKLVLTGTPLENSPEDVWSIFDFLNPGMLGNNESFKRMYSGIENDLNKQKELSDRIAPFILRRHKIEVEQLPEKTEKTLYCELLPSQQKLYDSILREGRTKYDMFASGKSTRFDVLSSLTRMRQICCHPGLLPDLLRKGENESAKIELLKELVLETLDSGQKTLIFSQFTSLLAIVRDWLKEQGIVFEYLDGSTIDRQARVNRFNSDKNIKLFLLSLKAGGTGLNLTSASNVIIYDPWWNPTAELQAADRIHRIGQKMPVTTYKLVVRDSIEEKILELQQKKQGLFNGIIENSSGIRKLSDKDLAFLFSGGNM